MANRPAQVNRIDVEASSGNVFADLGLPNPEQELLKADLTLQVYKALEARKLTRMQAGKVLGIPQPRVSDLLNGRARSVSAERLMDSSRRWGTTSRSGSGAPAKLEGTYRSSCRVASRSADAGRLGKRGGDEFPPTDGELPSVVDLNYRSSYF